MAGWPQSRTAARFLAGPPAANPERPVPRQARIAMEVSHQARVASSTARSSLKGAPRSERIARHRTQPASSPRSSRRIHLNEGRQQARGEPFRLARLRHRTEEVSNGVSRHVGRDRPEHGLGVLVFSAVRFLLAVGLRPQTPYDSGALDRPRQESPFSARRSRFRTHSHAARRQ
jgi:hypothetical protein